MITPKPRNSAAADRVLDSVANVRPRSDDAGPHCPANAFAVTCGVFAANVGQTVGSQEEADTERIAA